MGLFIEIESPERILSKGNHVGFDWIVAHNYGGIRCGYVKVKPGHLWHGKYHLGDVKTHGRITFAEGDTKDDGWWVGFDCGHGFDLPDPNLPHEYPWLMNLTTELNRVLKSQATIKTQEYVEAECKKLCELAANFNQTQS